MAESSETDESEIEDIATKFPGPITLLASRLKWGMMIVVSGGMTALGIFAISDMGDGRMEVGKLIFSTIFFGLGAMVSVITLHSGSLRLDEDGFEVTGLFRKRYRWSEVSDFGVFYYRGTASVIFKTTKPRWNILGKLNALLTGGRNGWLPDTYGFGAGELVQLMKSWQNSATNAISRFGV